MPSSQALDRKFFNEGSSPQFRPALRDFTDNSNTHFHTQRIVSPIRHAIQILKGLKYIELLYDLFR